MKTFHTAIGIMVAAATFAAEQPFARYQTIIDRKPFGPEPVNFDPDSTPGSAAAAAEAASGEMTEEQRTAEEQQLAASVRVSILNVTPSGAVKVGFTDSSAKSPENYYLAVGASQNGWTVKAADPSAESVTLAKDGIEVTVKLGESVGGGKGGGARRGSQNAGTLARRRPGGSDAAAGGGAAHSVGGLARLRQHRMEIAEREREDAARRREAEEREKAEREEREKREAEEKARAAEERAQQREALLQIQEQLKRAREEREASKHQEEQSEADDVN